MGNPGAPRRHTPQSVLRALRNRDRAEHPVATTGEVAELHGASRPVIKERLEELIERGDVQTAKVGGTDVYWPSDETLVSPAETAARRQHDQEDLSSDIAERVAASIIEDLDPETANIFKRLEEEVEPDEEAEPEVVTDGAVGTASALGEGFDKLLRSNRELIKENRARRKREKMREQQMHELGKPFLCIAVGMLISIIHGFSPLPEYILGTAGLLMIVGVVWFAWKWYFQPAPDEEIDAELEEVGGQRMAESDQE